MKRAKKGIALLLVLAMAVSCLCMPAMAAGPGGPGGGQTMEAADVAGTYQDSVSGTTLDLDDANNYALTGEGVDISGKYTLTTQGSPSGTSIIITFEDLSEEEQQLLKDTYLWYWNGTVTLGLDEGTFAPSGNVGEAEVDYTYEFEKSDESPTGYYTTFTVKDEGYDAVYAYGAWLASKLEQISEKEYDLTTYAPEDWENGMYYSGESTIPMEKDEENGVWTLTLPLASGTIGVLCYHDLNPDYPGANKARIPDNKKIITPYDEVKQSESFDWSVAAPNEKAGTMEYVDIDAYYTEPGPATVSKGEQQVQLSIYTPYGYDENREEPYPVLYLVPGGGTTYTTWYTGGYANNVFDNLIAKGAVEPTILVSMSIFAASDALVNDIIPYIEEHYNASSDPADRAVIGTSMGSASVTDLWMDQDTTELFAYYGFFSGVDAVFKDPNYTIEDAALLAKMKSATIAIGGGTSDFNMFAGDSNSASIYELHQWMNANGVEHTYAVKGGGHSFDTWLQMMVPFVEDYLWKAEEPAPAEPGPVEPEPVEPGPAEPENATYVVAAGDSLWKIALRQYGSGSMWNVIYEANKSTIKNPNMIYVGQELILPSVK